MRNPKKTRPSSARTKWDVGFTSDQLLIAVCIFLVVVLVCFAAGVWVGRHDRSYQPGPTAESSERPESPSIPTSPKPKDRDAGEGVQKSPRPVEMPVTPAKPKAGEGSKPRVTEHPAPAKKPAKEPEPAPKVKPAVQEESTGPPAPETPDKTTNGEENLLEPVAKPAATPLKRGPFAIQAASFSGPSRAKLAEDFKNQLEGELKLSAELERSEDDKFVRVLLGDYPDHEAAAKACNDLKKRPGLAGSFVKARD